MRAVNCTNLSLEASELHCPELRVLNLFGCRQVDAEGALRRCWPCVRGCACCPPVEMQSGPAQITVPAGPAGIEAVAPSLTKCAHLDLTGCIALPRLLLPDATALQTVRCASPGFASSARAWRLPCAASLPTLAHSPSAASACSVAGCGVLRQVLLASPALYQFWAAGCSRLMVSACTAGNVPGGVTLLHWLLLRPACLQHPSSLPFSRRSCGWAMCRCSVWILRTASTCGRCS